MTKWYGKTVTKLVFTFALILTLSGWEARGQVLQ